jgi:hypothetical protein
MFGIRYPGAGRVGSTAVSRRTLLHAGGALALTGLVGHSSLGVALAQDATPAAGSYPTVEITARNYAFNIPANIAGGWTQLTFHNEGPADHHAMFIKLNDGTTFDDFKKASEAPDLGALFALGVSIGGAPTISAGQTASAILNFDPGNYAVICAIPDENGKPHYQMGMLNSVEVTTDTTELAQPQSDASVELTEFMFTGLPATVTTGAHTWEVKDTGRQLHEFVVYQIVAPGMTFDQVKGILMASAATPTASPAAESSPPAGGPPFIAVGGTGPMSPGYTNYAVLDLKAAEYFAICFVPDVATGAPHFALGMMMGFTVS